MPLPKCVKVDFIDTKSAAVLIEEGWRDIGVLELWEGKIQGKIRGAKLISDDNGKKPFINCIPEFGFSGRLWRDGLFGELDAIDETRRFMIDADLFYATEDGFGIFTRRGEYLYIDLIGVFNRRKGVAQDIIRSAIYDLETDHLWAGTYSDNVIARKLYESLEMHLNYRYRVFHK